MIKEDDFNEVLPLTFEKIRHIIHRDGFFITGFVLTRENGEKCIVDMSAVRWLSKDEFFNLMHPDN